MDTKTCVCGSTRIERTEDVGWDCWPGGEERQHEDRCLECGATRFVCDWVNDGEQGTSYGKWRRSGVGTEIAKENDDERVV